MESFGVEGVTFSRGVGNDVAVLLGDGCES